jgi:glycosyltransferase involved in cell wall biosynthesis
MRTLFLSPQPFFQERGTPIAVRLALEVLSKRNGDSIDLLVYHEGTDVEISGVTVHRIPAFSFLNNVRPSISCKKLLCDLIFFFSALNLIVRNRSKQFQLIHAVEESVFMAYFFKIFFRIPYVYDMDSSLSMQLTEKWALLKPLKPILSSLEKLAVKNSRAVVPVCDALAIIAEGHGAPDMQIVRDISLLSEQSLDSEIDLRTELKLTSAQEIVLYIGNLESYQGIDLLIESFEIVAQQNSSAQLIIVGGSVEHISNYRTKVQKLALTQRIHLIGPRPVSALRSLLLQADILASPRTKGENTPMKIYSYLHSGRAIVATNLPTNTQVLDNHTSLLSEPTPQAFGAAILTLLNDAKQRQILGEAGYAKAEKLYTLEVFSESLNALYDRIAS